MIIIIFIFLDIFFIIVFIKIIIFYYFSTQNKIYNIYFSHIIKLKKLFIFIKEFIILFYRIYLLSLERFL